MDFSSNVFDWQLISLFLLVIFMAKALIGDIRDHRISNQQISWMLSAGVVLNGLGPSGDGEGMLTSHPGALGTRLSLAGAFMGLVLLLPLYRLRALGGGDVKLMGALGSFFGPVEIINLTLSILITGGCLAAVRLFWIDKTRLALANIAGLLTCVTTSKDLHFDPSTQSVERMPFVPAIALGNLVYGLWRWHGGAQFIHF
jgi:prepilin peptidase CpaA